MMLRINKALELHLLQPGDAAELFAVTDANRAHLHSWLPWLDGTNSEKDTLGFIEHMLRQHSEGKGFTTTLRHEGSIIGVIGFNRIEKANRLGAIGYWLAESHTGRGFMTAAARTLVDYGFTGLNLNRQIIACAKDNQRSRAIPERLGFKLEGIAREAEYLYDHFVDHAIYSLLRAEAVFIEQAAATDLPQLLELTTSCVASMRSHGIEQWDDVYPAASDHSRDISRGTLHLLRDHGNVVGCITIDDQPDPMWNGMDWHDESGGFLCVHRLMVHPSRQGQGLAKRLMIHAETLALAKGCGAIRLDTFLQNPAALALYERLGYRRTGTAMMRKGAFVCLEKLL